MTNMVIVMISAPSGPHRLLSGVRIGWVAARASQRPDRGFPVQPPARVAVPGSMKLPRLM
jgi:hypothetical protein